MPLTRRPKHALFSGEKMTFWKIENGKEQEFQINRDGKIEPTGLIREVKKEERPFIRVLNYRTFERRLELSSSVC